MSHTLEMLEMRLAGLSRQVALLTDRVQECERGAAGDRLVLVEWCRLNGVTMAQALGPERNRAIRALRDSLSAARVGRVFGLTGRQVREICRNDDIRRAQTDSHQPEK